MSADQIPFFSITPPTLLLVHHKGEGILPDESCTAAVSKPVQYCPVLHSKMNYIHHLFSFVSLSLSLPLSLPLSLSLYLSVHLSMPLSFPPFATGRQ